MIRDSIGDTDCVFIAVPLYPLFQSGRCRNNDIKKLKQIDKNIKTL